MDISANNIVTEIKFSTEINNIHTQGTVSQIFDLGLSFFKLTDRPYGHQSNDLHTFYTIK